MNCSAQEIYTLLRHYDKILLTAHVSPDGDAIGSLLALWHWLQLQGKKAVMVIDDDIDDRYDFLDGLQYINKPEQVETDDSWLTVVLDATGLGRIGQSEKLIRGKVLNIDHHISNEHFAQWEYVRPDCAATGEILTYLFDLWQRDWNTAMADALYTAIATDCGFFKFNNTTGHTLRMAALLVDHGARPDFISEHLDARSLEKLKALSQVLEHLELFDDGRISCLSYTPEVLKITGEHTGMYMDYARNVKGAEVAFTVKYVSDKETRVSLRSKGIDVNAVAAVFGGGGHVRAAGCTLDKPLDEAKKLIVKEIEKRL